MHCSQTVAGGTQALWDPPHISPRSARCFNNTSTEPTTDITRPKTTRKPAEGSRFLLLFFSLFGSSKGEDLSDVIRSSSEMTHQRLPRTSLQRPGRLGWWRDPAEESRLGENPIFPSLFDGCRICPGAKGKKSNHVFRKAISGQNSHPKSKPKTASSLTTRPSADPPCPTSRCPFSCCRSTTSSALSTSNSRPLQSDRNPQKLAHSHSW